jgi:hypothetical protein
MHKNSSEFDREGSGDVKKVVTKSGPAGYLVLLYFCAALFIIIVVGLWWWFR